MQANSVKIIWLEDHKDYVEDIKNDILESVAPKPKVKIIRTINGYKNFLNKNDNFIPDFVILDIIIDNDPRAGISMIEPTKEKWPEAFIFMLSNLTSGEILDEYGDLKVDDYLDKSTVEEDVKDIIKIIQEREYQQNSDDHSEIKEFFREYPGQTIRDIYYKELKPIFSNDDQEAIQTSIFVEGETGVGKEVVAKLCKKLLELQLKRNIEIERVNCRLLQNETAESMLFGHVKGAFTGAIEDKDGHFQQANKKGILFLDNIHLLDPKVQGMILNAVDDDRKFQKMGSNKDEEFNALLICTSSENMSQMVGNGKFRDELWQRITQKKIILKPLRERKNEIKDIAYSICRNHSKIKIPDPELYFREPILEMLKNKSWMGNVRQLRDCLISYFTKYGKRNGFMGKYKLDLIIREKDRIAIRNDKQARGGSEKIVDIQDYEDDNHDNKKVININFSIKLDERGRVNEIIPVEIYKKLSEKLSEKRLRNIIKHWTLDILQYRAFRLFALKLRKINLHVTSINELADEYAKIDPNTFRKWVEYAHDRGIMSDDERSLFIKK